MSEVVRLSVSMDRELEQKLEELVRRAGYANRSEFVRDLVRDRMVEGEWESEDEAVGTITLVYDHHQRGLHDRLTDIQHAHHDLVLATTHIHLDHHLCAEAIVCRGRASAIREIADRMRRERGVLHGALSMSSTGRGLLGHRYDEDPHHHGEADE